MCRYAKSGVTFKLGSAKVCSPVIFETYFSYLKDVFFLLLLNCAISIDSYTSIKKSYSFINFSLLIYDVILLLNCLVVSPDESQIFIEGHPLTAKVPDRGSFLALCLFVC